MTELVVDLFSGGGGASEGIRWALGRDPDVAVNHDEDAVSMHEANHPATRHLHGDVWHYGPRDVVGAAPVGLLWASPTCTFFSKAKGGPLDRRTATKIRALAWVVVRWAKDVRPRVIMVENVEAFASWGPLAVDGKPCRRRRGTTFRRWVRALEAEGYRVEWRELRACDYGAPTSRKRLFVIARRDGAPIVWPEPTHGPGRLPFRTAADCIDWSVPCPSIFGRAKPLAEATMRRIARGMRKFVLESGAPFLVHVSNGERPGQAPRIYDIAEPLGTVVAGGIKHALVTAFLTKYFGTSTGQPVQLALGTQTTNHHYGLVTAFMAKNFGGHESPGADLRAPMSTVTCRDHHALVAAFLTQYNGQSIGQPLGEPMNTVTTKDRFAVVVIKGERYTVADIGMRLLTPRELYRAQGFPDAYVIDRWTKTAQIRMAGNSVPPHLSAALVAANLDTEARRAA